MRTSSPICNWADASGMASRNNSPRRLSVNALGGILFMVPAPFNRPDTLIEGTNLAILGDLQEGVKTLHLKDLVPDEPSRDLQLPDRLRHITRPASWITQQQSDGWLAGREGETRSAKMVNAAES